MESPFFVIFANMQLNNPKIVRAWCMYDWANSVYSLVITSTIFPVYYENVTKQFFENEMVSFFGYQLPNTTLYSYALSFSFLFVALLSPLLSGIADYSGKKKAFMQFFTYLGGASCIVLYFFTGENIELGIIASVFASIGYSGSLVFYNAFLPEIASPDKYDVVSARGYSLGYLGSVLLLIVNLVMIENPTWFFGPDPTDAQSLELVKWSFLMVGVWWIGFAQITFKLLPNNPYNRKPKGQLLLKGYQELRSVWRRVKQYKNMKLYLGAFFFYNMGVQTVMYLAASFGAKELKLEGGSLILTVLIIQVVAIGGAYLFAQLSKMRGNRFSLLVQVLIWVVVCVLAYFTYTEYQFFGIAFIVGLVMGGIQSLSRASFSKLIPADTDDNTSYFSFYDVMDKVSTGLGTFVFGLVEHLTGGMRNSVLALITFFVIGFLLLLAVRIPKERSRL